MPFSQSSWSAQIWALCTSVTLFISLGILLSSVILLAFNTDWTLVLLRALLGFIGLGVVMLLQRIPAVQKVLEQSKEDDRTIAAHWTQDADLIRLTWYLRVGYVLSAIIMFVCVCMVMPYELKELHTIGCNLAYSGADEATRVRLLDAYLTSSWSVLLGSVSLLLFFIAITVSFLATCHIILYRNNPVKGFLFAMCKECYKYGGTVVAIGAPVTLGVHIGMAASPFMFKTTMATNMINIYFPLSQGYGYPLGTHLPHTRDSFLMLLPNYNPRDLLGPDSILDAQKQDTFIHENIGRIRKKFSLSQLQAMGIDPPIVSNYGTGLAKTGE
jgi:hypothetical protein